MLRLSKHLVSWLQVRPPREVTVIAQNPQDPDAEAERSTLGYAISQDFWGRAMAGDTATKTWPVNLRYRGFDGTAFEDVFDLQFTADQRATLRLRPKQPQ